MDHLRSGIGLVGYAQVDPKTEYKREGMKEFDAMWDGVQDKVTEAVFRMEERKAFQKSVWARPARGGPARRGRRRQHERHDDAMPPKATRSRSRSATAARSVGRNDPCPCGSGKKYKNCHMRQSAAGGEAVMDGGRLH